MKFELLTSIKVVLIGLVLGLSGCAQQSSLHSSADQLVQVRLEEVDEGTTAQAFGKVLRAAEGVVDAKRYSASIVPGDPQNSYVLWRVLTSYADPLRLEDSIIDGINAVLRSGGRAVINGMDFDFTPAEIEMLKGIRLIDATANQLRYIVDRELARDRDFSGRLDPFKTQ
jgi:hypothetical protein